VPIAYLPASQAAAGATSTQPLGSMIQEFQQAQSHISAGFPRVKAKVGESHRVKVTAAIAATATIASVVILHVMST